MEPLRLLVELLAGLLASSLCLLDLSPRNLPGSWFGDSLDNWLALCPMVLSPPNLLTPFGCKGITMILLCDDNITLMSLFSLQSPTTASKIHIISLLSITSQNCDAMALGARFEAMVIILKVYSSSRYKTRSSPSRTCFSEQKLNLGSVHTEFRIREVLVGNTYLCKFCEVEEEVSVRSGETLDFLPFRWASYELLESSWHQE
jgi:hypothetical protein